MTCRWCKRRIEQPRTGRRRLYCSNACKQHAYQERRLKAAAEAGEQRARERPFLA